MAIPINRPTYSNILKDFDEPQDGFGTMVSRLIVLISVDFEFEFKINRFSLIKFGTCNSFVISVRTWRYGPVPKKREEKGKGKRKKNFFSY